MLSIEDPPHPPCSSKISELTADEGAAKKLASQEAADLVLVAVPGDEIKHQPPFSIRDYVSATRSKDVGVNWPFSPHLLQFCLKHGIKDPLPPFEHPHFVRAQHCREGFGPNQPIALVDSEKTSQGVDVVEEEDPGLSDLNPNGFENLSHQLFSKSALESSDCAQSPLSEVDILPVEAGDEKLCRISKPVFSDEDCEETAPEASFELENIEPPQTACKTEALCEASGKKRRLIVKFGSQHNSVRAEENVLNPSTATESMTSKICPVCKTFTSTSNTTLNAHIDRCLAADSTSKWVVTKVTKKKVKPRKKKLMADIYLTAPSCTLEDLERRNCISWAVNSISPIQNDEVLTENKKQRMIQANYNDDGEECVLCDDSNGTVPTAVENCKHRENMKDSVDKRFLISKEKHLASTASKYMNVQPRSKKLCNIMHLNGEIHEAPDAKYHAKKNHEKEERLSQLLKAQDSFKGRTGTLRQWVCSKRMRLLKKLNERSGHHGANEDQLLATQKPLSQRNQSALGNSSVQRRHIHKLSRFSVNADASPNIQSKTGMVTDDKMNSPQPPKNNSNRLIERSSFLGDGHNENFSRSLENNISTRSKRVKIDKSAAKESPKLSESFPFSPKYKKSVSSENMLSGKSFSSVGINKCYENSKRPPRKKLRKLTFKPRERCMVEMRDQVVELPFNEDKGIDRSLDNIMVSETEDFASKVLKSGHERQEAMIASNIPESITPKGFISSKPDRMHVDSEFGGCLHQHISSDVCAFNSSNQFFYAEGITILNGQSGSSYSFGEEHVGSTFGSEAWAEPIRPRPCDNQEGCCTKDGELGGTSSRTIAEVNNLLEGNFSDDEYMGCGTESIAIQESDGGLEALLEKLLVTSGGPGFIEYQQDLVNGNTSQSPISVISAISSPSMGLSSFKCPEMESSDNSTKSSLVDAIDSGPSAALPSAERTKSETGNTEFKISTGKECANFSDYEPCCYLQKASVNWGPSPIFQESSKLMPMTSDQNISLESYNSFMTNQSLRTDAEVDTASRMMMGPISIKESFDDEVLSCTDLRFAGPSSMTQLTSSPILRLMGQNLMVANNEKEAVQRLGVSLGRAEINKTNERNVVCAGFCGGNISGQDTLSQNSNVDFSNNLRSCSNSKKPPTPPHLPCNHQDHLHMGGFMFSGFAAVKR